MNIKTPSDILQDQVDRIMADADETGADPIESGRKFQALIDQGHTKKYILEAAGVHKRRVNQSLTLAAAPSKIIELYKSGACTNMATLGYLVQIHKYDERRFMELYQKAKQGNLPSVEAQIVAQECTSKHRARSGRWDKVPYRPKVTLQPDGAEEDMLDRLESALRSRP